MIRGPPAALTPFLPALGVLPLLGQSAVFRL